jgi:glycosyltransferase involved in cell wall biosynthesis
MSGARIGLAYHPSGFSQRGGIQRLAIGVAEHLRQQGVLVSLLTAAPGAQGDLPQGLEWLDCNSRLRDLDSLVIIGCNQPWAYGLAMQALLLPGGPQIHWLPSFHDPRWVAHPHRARLAQRVLKRLQRAGVIVHGQTQHEVNLLNGGRCRLSSHGLSDSLKQQLNAASAAGDGASVGDDISAGEVRPLDLLFLGRPTAQKGWPQFVSVARLSGLRCGAVVPFLPDEAELHGIELVLNPSDAEIPLLLRRAKLVLIPADYESFGIAQLEALAQGCLVPILGCWPLWDGFQSLQWQGFNPNQLATACQQICHDQGQRLALVAQQLAFLRRHPIQRQPFLSGLTTSSAKAENP